MPALAALRDMLYPYFLRQHAAKFVYRAQCVPCSESHETSMDISAIRVFAFTPRPDVTVVVYVSATWQYSVSA